MREFAAEIDSKPLVPDSVKEMQKSLYFALVMAPRSFYDLKTNSNWLSSADAGNYNYGYLGSALGIEKNTLIQMSGFVQMASDMSDVDDYPFLTNFVQGVASGDFSQFDNIPEDPEEINSGYDAEQDGCKPDTGNSSQNSSGQTGASSSGWSSGFFIGVSGCIGRCSIPNGVVEVTDLEQP